MEVGAVRGRRVACTTWPDEPNYQGVPALRCLEVSNITRLRGTGAQSKLPFYPGDPRIEQFWMDAKAAEEELQGRVTGRGVA
jgi:hypothetical protein